MAPIDRKRARNEVSLRSRKKQRYNQASPRSFQNSTAQTVALDTLLWQEVAFPESGFEDAEGFFGLEEVSDVDVVIESKLGKVEYKIHPHRSGVRPTKGGESTAPGAAENGDPKEEEWGGFEDQEAGSQAARIFKETMTAKEDTSKFKANVKKRRKTEDKDHMFKQSPTKILHNTFEALNSADGNAEDAVDVSAWESLNLSSATLSALARMTFTTPTAIQQAAVPDILRGHDVIGKAPTGSGKTLAYGLPIYEHFVRMRPIPQSKQGKTGSHTHPPIALILSPTRELAHQLSAHLTALFSSPDSTIATVTGGLSVHKQQRLLAGADIIIGTPGRLWEVMSESAELQKSLRSIKFLVVDEADRLLSEGHFEEVEEILRILDRESTVLDDGPVDDVIASQGKQHRQTLVFSATFQKDLQQKLAGKGKPVGGDLIGNNESMEYLLKKLNFAEQKPKFIDVNPTSQMATGLREGIVECAGTEKDLYLYAVLLQHPRTRTLIFANSITSVRRLTPFLQNLNLSAQALHSQMPQKARLRSIERFSSLSSEYSILVATDVAARGLDIPSVQLVVHYHLPRAADTYVHRSGRTARAQNSGSSILLCAPEEIQGVHRLVAKVHARNGSNSADDSKRFFMRTIELDRRIVTRLKHRVVISKRLSDAALAKEKKGQEDNWLKSAADELGVEYDSDEFAAGEGNSKGRGQGRKKKESEARGMTKAEVGALRAELREELGKRVNAGVSERYLTAGGIDVDELLRGGNEEFLGRVAGVMEDI